MAAMFTKYRQRSLLNDSGIGNGDSNYSEFLPFHRIGEKKAALKTSVLIVWQNVDDETNHIDDHRP